MDHQKCIEKTIAFVKSKLKDSEPGHNWWHVKRVWDIAKGIAKNYNTDPLLIDLGALLHDIADSKFHDGDENIGPEIAEDFLDSLNIIKSIKVKVLKIIKYVSFKNKDEQQPDFIEFKIIQDADRLDAMGAIGIARAFSYGGYIKREFYHPEKLPNPGQTKQEYKKSAAPTINHFYEKLLHLKNMMNTMEAKKIAEKRHDFMLKYLEQFVEESNFPAIRR